MPKDWIEVFLLAKRTVYLLPLVQGSSLAPPMGCATLATKGRQVLLLLPPPTLQERQHSLTWPCLVLKKEGKFPGQVELRIFL